MKERPDRILTDKEVESLNKLFNGVKEVSMQPLPADRKAKVKGKRWGFGYVRLTKRGLFKIGVWLWPPSIEIQLPKNEEES
jgi:hypothetical protein